MLARVNDDFCDSHFLLLAQDLAKQRIGAMAILERFEVIGFVIVDRADLGRIDKIRDRDALRGLDVRACKVVV